jgi:carboxypeptidase PM20D1
MLAERGVEVEVVLDEGTGLVGPGVYPYLNRPVALVSTAEKGYMSMQVSTSALGGGHSSRPSLSGTPISVLAAACSKIQNNQFPARISPPMTDFLDAAAKELVSTAQGG